MDETAPSPAELSAKIQAGEPLDELAAVRLLMGAAPDLLRQFDAQAARLTQVLGLGPSGEQLAWALLKIYAGQAQGAAREETQFRGVALTPYVQIVGSQVRAVTLTGEGLAGALLEPVDELTGKPAPTFADEACTMPQPWPLTAGPDGLFPEMHAPPGTRMALNLRDPAGKLLISFGPVTSSGEAH